MDDIGRAKQANPRYKAMVEVIAGRSLGSLEKRELLRVELHRIQVMLEGSNFFDGDVK
jgi:hypothetical protein